VNRFLSKSCILIFTLTMGIGAFAQDWNGLYVGGTAGGVKGRSNTYTSTVFSPVGYFAPNSIPAIASAGNQPLSPRGFSGGGTAGYNFQRNHWVLGLEGDFGVMHIKDDFSATAVYPCCSPTTFTVTQTVNSDWLLTVRPRVGFTNGPVLIYGTAGLAMTNFNYKEDFIDTFATAHESASMSGLQTGLVGGGGVEFKVASRWSLKGEYLHADFGSGLKTTSSNLTCCGPPPVPRPNVFTHQADLSAHIIRAGINYHF
jgi:outer membrane immunogenic protein